MPRALRLESENASYHVINRGNYRAPVFAHADTRRAFLRCLDEACVKTRWRVHAWCIMSNHYHLAITTPEANLAAGMHWLQCTFAIRFNRLRDERGHLFQSRYKSLAVETGEALGSVCHYIHLNPVRANLCAVGQLMRYPWTSLATWRRPSDRPGWYDPHPALQHAGGLEDTPKGHIRYEEYLAWLAEDEPAQKRLKFDRMCRGWALGSDDFAKALMQETRELRSCGTRLAAEMRADHEACWRCELDVLLHKLGRTHADLTSSAKSAEWKIALAAALKVRTTADNPWLSQHLYLGCRWEVGRKAAAWLRDPHPQLFRQLGLHHTLHNPTPCYGEKTVKLCLRWFEDCGHGGGMKRLLRERRRSATGP